MEYNEQIISEQYQQFLVEITDLVQSHRIQAIQSVQIISNNLYWNIGELIIKKQKEFGWGKSIVEILSKDLTKLIGEGISWSPRNLWFMRQLVNEYSNLNQLDSESPNLNQADSDLYLENIKQLVTSIPWQHNILIIQKIKDPKARIFYIQSTIKNKYSRSVLLHQIKANAYENYLQSPPQNNFKTVLAGQHWEQAKESIKSIYALDFLDEKNHLEVEYALKSANKPIGVSEYILSKKLPKELEGKLPTSEQFKNILNE